MTLFTFVLHFALLVNYLLPPALADYAEKTDTADTSDFKYAAYKGKTKPEKKDSPAKCLVGDVELNIVGGRCDYKNHQGRCQPGEFECGPVFSHICVSTNDENISMRCSEAYGMKLLKNNTVATPSSDSPR